MSNIHRTHILLAMAAVLFLALLFQGCGGTGPGVSTISGTIADINRNTVVGAEVWVDDLHKTESLVSGTFRIDGTPSGWQTVRAKATIAGETWVGTTAAEILHNEPTMNVNIVLVPESNTTQIGGSVKDNRGHTVSGTRVFLTTRTLAPSDSTSSSDGPYGSIVALTDANGRYLMEDVPVGASVTLAASKVGFKNQEIAQTTSSDGVIVNFDLVKSTLTDGPSSPILDAIETYTMPESVTRSGNSEAYKAVRTFTSKRYRRSLSKQKTVITRATPAGSVIEIDLYWNALDLNDSRNLAGYGIYRTTTLSEDLKSIDFVRDPYANFYGDTGAEITPNKTYYYAVSSVDVQFLDQSNNPDPASESNLSNTLKVIPLDQLAVLQPMQAETVSANPQFAWTTLRDADSYAIYLYDKFPTLPLDPGFNYGSDPVVNSGVLPVWPRTSNPGESTVGASATSFSYNGPALIPGHTYYWLVLASKTYDSSRSAFSYSEIRHFTVE